MKRLVSILLLLSLLLCGCTSVEKAGKAGDFFFYFPAEDPYETGGFISVERTFGETMPETEELLSMYFLTDVPEGGKPLLPQGWKMSSWELQSGQLTLYFEGADASYIEESQALACLTRTFSQREDVYRIKLCPPGDREPLLLSDKDLMVEDMGMFPREELVLYFPDEEFRYLHRETFVVDSLAEEDKPAYIVSRLLEGDETGEHHSCIPSGTKMLGIQVENGVCTVDLSSEFARKMPQQFHIARLAVYSIVNSLTELEGIRTVDIHVAHSSMERLRHMDMSKGLQRDESLFGGGSGYDGSIYPYAIENGLLVEVPVWIREDPAYSLEEQLIRALLEFESEHFIRHSIPKGTSLLSVRMAENTCVVDLTAEFTDLSENLYSQTLAIYSMIATLSTLPYVDAVEILVEGNRPQHHTDIFRELRTVDEKWFAEGEYRNFSDVN